MFSQLSYFCSLSLFQADRAAARKKGKSAPEEEKLLLGLPISVKDQFVQKGCDSTMGLAVRCFNPAAEDGLLIHLLRAQGAIPFVRTNVPQSLLLPESVYIIFFNYHQSISRSFHFTYTTMFLLLGKYHLGLLQQPVGFDSKSRWIQR